MPTAPNELALNWEELPALPDPIGFAGMYAGSSGSALIAAGGHQFERGLPPWKGGTKRWSDAIFALHSKESEWKVQAARLPRPMGDGFSLGYHHRVICGGGADGEQAYPDVFALESTHGSVTVDALPPLPAPRWHPGGAIVRHHLFVIGGKERPGASKGLDTLLALDLAAPRDKQRWIEMAPLPGPGRMFPIVASGKDAFYLFGGIEVFESAGQPRHRTPYLQDAFRFTPATSPTSGTWQRICPPPRPLAAAPSPAWMPDDRHIVVFGGIDGSLEGLADPAAVRSLPANVLAYDLARDQWHELGMMPALVQSRVNAPTANWDGRYVIVSGENLPGCRLNTCPCVRLEY